MERKNIINPIELELMVRRINRNIIDPDAIHGLLEDTFQRQIGAGRKSETTTVKPGNRDQYEEVEARDGNGKPVPGWRKTILKNSDDPREVFGYFKHAVENIREYYFPTNGFGRPLSVDNVLVFKPGAVTVVNDWLQKKEAELSDGLPNAARGRNAVAYDYDSDAITKVFNFCNSNAFRVFKGITAHQFGECVATADFSAIHQSPDTGKTRLKYIISVLSHIVPGAGWYAAAAKSIGVTTSKCSGANFSSDEWKNAADALKKHRAP